MYLRKCRVCGIEAHTEAELDLFMKHKTCKYGRNTLCRNCRRLYKHKWEEKNRLSERKRTGGNRYRHNLKIKVINLYGGVCVCCGEKTMVFLSIDHINGGGSKEIQSMGCRYKYYKFLEKQFCDNREAALKKYQILCHNCNMGRYINGGICPHKDPNYEKKWVLRIDY